jgi:hypothetical protein
MALATGSELGHGPDHPTAPQPALRPMVEAFLAEFPFLEWYPDYVWFLRTYAGAGTSDPDPGDPKFVFLSLSGWSANVQFIDRDFDVVDARGFYGFCELHYRYRPYDLEVARNSPTAFSGCVVSEFTFDATGRRQRGVYVESCVDGLRVLGSGECVWYCSSFTAWLERLIAARGRIPPLDWVRQFSL